MALNKDGNEVWFDGFVPEGKIYRIDALTGKITGSWQPPTHGLPAAFRLRTTASSGSTNSKAGIGRFDPKTETFKEFQLPGGHPLYALGIDRDNMVWYSSEDMDEVGRLDPNTGKITEYPFPHMENKMREFTMDAQGRMWWASPANNKVGYFYLANNKERASKCLTLLFLVLSSRASQRDGRRSSAATRTFSSILKLLLFTLSC